MEKDPMKKSKTVFFKHQTSSSESEEECSDDDKVIPLWQVLEEMDDKGEQIKKK